MKSVRAEIQRRTKYDSGTLLNRDFVWVDEQIWGDEEPWHRVPLPVYVSSVGWATFWKRLEWNW